MAKKPKDPNAPPARQPWMKFYCADWRSNIELRAVSIGARGLWMEMLCLMHEATPRGSLVLNGRQITPRQLAVFAGVPLKDTEALLAELQDASVYSRDDDGTIFSRRMRRDIEKAERDKANGSGGGNPALTNGITGGLTPTDNPSDKLGRRTVVIREDKAHGTRTRATSEARYIPSQEEADLGLGDTCGDLGEGDPRGLNGCRPDPDPMAWDDDAPFGRVPS